MTERLKIIQWATGNIGSRSLRAVLEHPGMELVGLWVHSADKAGRDASELCGLVGVTGIVGTNDADELVSLDADCVLHMPHGSDIDLWERLLASGKNVVTTRGDFHFPDALEDEDRQRIEAACRKGNTSIYSTGVSPGLATEALIIPLLSLSRRLDSVMIEEFAALETRDSPHLLFEVMGFGEDMQPFQQARAEYLKGHFATSLAQVAQASGVEIEKWTARGELAAASEDVHIAAGTIRKGTVAAQRITISGMADGNPVFSFRANWYATDKLADVDWELRESGWRIVVKSDTPMDVGITYPVAPEDYAAFTPGLTAHRAVNSVRAVCEAPPGIRTTVDMAQVIADLRPLVSVQG